MAVADIAEIRTALATILAGVSGVSSIGPYPAARVTTAGSGWLGEDDERVLMGQREVSIHQLPLIVVTSVGQGGDYGKAIAATEPIIKGVKDAIRANQSLGLAYVDRVAYTRFQQGTKKVGEDTFAGFSCWLEIKTSEAVTLSG